MEAVHLWISALPARHRPSSPVFATVLVAILLGTGSGLVVAQVDSGDQIVVGNTGGTLSAVIRVHGSIIVAGGGNARSDLADLVGRSTVPWRRHVDLLILPGWDDQQPIGALGLLERGDVGQIVILGQPANSAVWTALEQAAAKAAVPVTVISGHNVVRMTPNVQLDLLAAQPSASPTTQYSILSLHYFQSTITIVDASKDGVATMTAEGVVIPRSHLLAVMRPLTSASGQADLLLQPRASKASDVMSLGGQYAAEISTGRHIVISLSQNELRVPLTEVTPLSSPSS